MKRNPGIIYFTDGLPGPELERFALRLEELGYDSLWVPEFFGREPYTTAAFVLARTSRLVVATGIANVYARHAIVAAQHRHALAELSGGRFVLGLGVSHPPMAEAHGLEWLAPVVKMRAYLDGIDAMQVRAPKPAEPAPIWISAHGPLLLKLAAERADGANTYLAPPPHTARAREILGPDKRLNVVLHCCLSEDETAARRIARRALSVYLPLPAYHRVWRAWGFEESDWADGASDRLVDKLVAWGDHASIRRRMDEHLAAGASQIIISPLNPDGNAPPWKLLEAFAP